MSGFNFSNFFRNAKAHSQRQIAAAVVAVDVFGEQMIGDAAQLAPVGGGTVSPNDPAPGTLQASATTTPAVIDGQSISKTIGFNTVYAAAQHEGLDFAHDVGQAKFLEQALRNGTAKFSPFVAGRVGAVS